jgi:hypothetical protein
METPNLFDFATKELSQDAFICWLASRTNPPCRTVDGRLHQTATLFLDRLVEVGGRPKMSAYSSVVIRRQEVNFDVLVVVNGHRMVGKIEHYSK